MTSTREANIIVSPDMFGTNYLATFYSTDAKFENVLDVMNVTTLRFPGGEITESSFSIYEPNRNIDDRGRTITPLNEFLDFCIETGNRAIIVLPTRNLLTAEADANGHRLADEVKIQDTIDFVISFLNDYIHLGIDRLLELVDAFEVGNEYWGSGEMTGTEYGRIINKLLPSLYEEIRSEFGQLAADDINLLVQMGAPWSRDYDPGGLIDKISTSTDPNLLNELGIRDRDFNFAGDLNWLSKVRIENELIIRELESEAIDAIGGLVEHYYFGNITGDISYTSPTLNYINHDLMVWEKHGIIDRDLYITEWNISTNSLDQLGLKGASALLVQFEYMLRLGADAAFVWPIQHNTRTDLAGVYGVDPDLSASGYIFQHLAENTVGMELQNIDLPNEGIELVYFKSDNQIVVYIASRLETNSSVKMEIGDLIGNDLEYSVTSVGILGVDASTSDGVHKIDKTAFFVAPYGEHDARGSVTILDPSEFGPDKEFIFDLDPYEIVMMTAKIKNVGTVPIESPGNIPPEGSDGNQSFRPAAPVEMARYTDWLSDPGWLNSKLQSIVLTGTNDNDTLNGASGSDYISAGNGNDLIHTGFGMDTVLAGSGNDTVLAAGGNNTIWGGAGNDYLRSRSGNDTIGAGSGDDTIDGGSGSNTIWAGSGDDLASGGDGNDQIGGGAGNDRIYGFGGDDLIFGGLSNDTIHAGDGNDTVWGGSGDDFINGGAGNDRISAGSGFNYIWGGEGADTFIFFRNSGEATILDFNENEGDKIEINQWFLPLGSSMTADQIVATYGYMDARGGVLDFTYADTIIRVDGLTNLSELADTLLLL